MSEHINTSAAVALFSQDPSRRRVKLQPESGFRIYSTSNSPFCLLAVKHVARTKTCVRLSILQELNPSANIPNPFYAIDSPYPAQRSYAILPKAKSNVPSLLTQMQVKKKKTTKAFGVHDARRSQQDQPALWDGCFETKSIK